MEVSSCGHVQDQDQDPDMVLQLHEDHSAA
jgi:hypothetical protein